MHPISLCIEAVVLKLWGASHPVGQGWEGWIMFARCNFFRAVLEIQVQFGGGVFKHFVFFCWQMFYESERKTCSSCKQTIATCGGKKCLIKSPGLAHNWLPTLIRTVTNTPTVETDVGMIRQYNYRCDRTSVYSFMASPANQHWQTAGLLKHWCIAESSRWAEPAKRLSSCSLCHYDYAPHLVAQQSTRSNNTTGEEHQHYINCEHHQGENWVSRGAEEQTDGWHEEKGVTEDHRELVFAFVFICFLFHFLLLVFLSQLCSLPQPPGIGIIGVCITVLH